MRLYGRIKLISYLYPWYHRYRGWGACHQIQTYESGILAYFIKGNGKSIWQVYSSKKIGTTQPKNLGAKHSPSQVYILAVILKLCLDNHELSRPQHFETNAPLKKKHDFQTIKHVHWKRLLRTQNVIKKHHLPKHCRQSRVPTISTTALCQASLWKPRWAVHRERVEPPVGARKVQQVQKQGSLYYQTQTSWRH